MSKSSKALTKRQREALRRRQQRQRSIFGTASIAVLAIVIVVAIVIQRQSSSSSEPSAAPTSSSGLRGLLTGPPPWSANIDQLGARLHALGLPALATEGTALHIHQHLDVFVDGERVTVPAGIGIQQSQGFISPLHTHDDSGIIHVESPTRRDFTLGEVFGVWGVRLTRECLGGSCGGGGKELRVFVDGERVEGDPTQVVLASHQEIVVAFGTAAELPDPIPSSYDFPAGL